jgi:ferredoxin-thioredoxin reductase catalytic chain
MTFFEISDAAINTEYMIIKKEGEEGGYHLNPDADFSKMLIRGLMKNNQRYGYPACPCRLASGKKELDLDIVCPCDYRDSDLEEFGACYCALYVNEAIASGAKQPMPVPERRPPRSERGSSRAVHTVLTGPHPDFPLPIWRCKVCGYLCARDQPPSVCPICKAKKDRFERFI